MEELIGFIIFVVLAVVSSFMNSGGSDSSGSHTSKPSDLEFDDWMAEISGGKKKGLKSSSQSPQFIQSKPITSGNSSGHEDFMYNHPQHAKNPHPDRANIHEFFTEMSAPLHQAPTGPEGGLGRKKNQSKQKQGEKKGADFTSTLTKSKKPAVVIPLSQKKKDQNSQKTAFLQAIMLSTALQKYNPSRLRDLLNKK